MRKKPIYGTDPEKILRLLSIGEDERDSDEAPEDSPVADGITGDKWNDGAPASREEMIERLHAHIEGYRIIKVLGEGGMGIVYLAEQQYPVRRQVALKIIKPGMDSKRVLARFEAEQQALAWLDHPNIAKVFDAGATETGCPFFVMEYVEGVPIKEFCDRNRLSIRNRLSLFSVVCHAIQHAHQKGIIHRDIKPSNILVAEQDGQPMPKIIDFGVAKAMGEPLTESTLKTEDSHLLGTPEYMSPEQANMAQELIDTRSDVYSLGVLLYVLLAGALPFEADALRKGGIENIRKTIGEIDPKTPSTRLTSLGDEAVKIAEMRGTEVSALAKRLKRELEWIPLKAMRKERAERYRSASELADDIANYLNSAPLIAGPPTALYRLKKFVRRNAVLSAAGLAVAVTLALGLAATTALYLRAEGALGREARARIEAQSIADFLTQDVLGSAKQVMGRDATAIDLLDAASAKLDEGVFKDQPLTELLVRYRLGKLIKDLGYAKKTIPHLERVRQIYTQHGAPESLTGNLILNYLALAYLRSGEPEEAEALFQTVIEDKEQIKGTSGLLYPWVKLKYAEICRMQARYDESERILLEMMQPQFRNGEGLREDYMVMCMCDLAETYRLQGRYEEAIRVYNEEPAQTYIRTQRALLTEPSRWLARLHLDLGRYPQAEKLLRAEIERIPHEFTGKDNVRQMSAMNDLGVVLTRKRDFKEAESLLQKALEVRRDKRGDEHPETLETIHNLGVLRREQRRYEEAESLLRQALDGRQRKLGLDHPDTLESMHELALLHVAKEEDYEKAAPLLIDAFHGRGTKLGPEHPYTIESLKQLVNLYESWNKPDEAAKWRAKLPRVEDAEEQH